jgi:biopolymer transport protein ExbD
MPVKLGSKLPVENEARIEIVPLIDIMFFLLAAFMLVSLSMVNQRNIRVNLPTATSASAEQTRNLINVSIDKSGVAYVEARPIATTDLAALLKGIQATNASARVFIGADKDTRHGDVVRVLDVVRGAGIEKIAFEIREGAAAPQ